MFCRDSHCKACHVSSRVSTKSSGILGQGILWIRAKSTRDHRCNYISNLGLAFQVARSRISDARVWRRACDFLGLMKDPAICSSILGPSRTAQGTTQRVGSINWSEGSTKMIAHIPFYILGEQEGERKFAPDVIHSWHYLHNFAFDSTSGEDN